MVDKKTLMNEVLPTPDRVKPKGETPRERAARRLQQLISVGAAMNLQACVGFGVVDMMPEPVACSTADDPNWFSWASASPQGDNIEVIVTLDIWQFEGLGFAGEVGVTDGTVVSGDPDENVTVILIEPDPDAVEMTVRVDVDCMGEVQSLRWLVDVEQVRTQGSVALVPVEE